MIYFSPYSKHAIGGSVGGFVTVGLGTSSYFSKSLRCSMLLVVPGLFAGRGRTVMLTLATGFLLDGPIDRHVPQSMFKSVSTFDFFSLNLTVF